MAKAITYQEIKKYINSDETGNGCRLLTTEEEFYEEKIKQNKSGGRTYLLIKCKCGENFTTCLDSFRSNNKKHCDECGFKIRNEHLSIKKIEKETKVCNRCNNELPLNETYYRKKKLRGKYTYYYICKQCEIELRFSNEVHIKDNQVGHKICNQCKRELPRTIEFFRSNPSSKDGLTTKCRECIGGDFKKENYINCKVCKNDLPATEEYFYKKEYGRYGLKTICKECDKMLYYLNHKEHLEYRKEYREDPENKIKRKEYLKSHKLEKSMSDKKYRLTPNGKLKRNLNEEKRRTLKLLLEANLTEKEWLECLHYFTEDDQNIHCSYCGIVLENPTQDHFIPISKGGNYTKDNIIPCCSSCNSSKSNKDFYKWYPTKEFYDISRQNKILKYLGRN